MKKSPAPAGGLSRKKLFVLGVALLFLIIIVTSLFGKRGVMDLRRARRELARLESQARVLEQEKAGLEAEIRRLESDPRAVEKSAREKLGLAAPGEKVIVLPESPPKK